MRGSITISKKDRAPDRRSLRTSLLSERALDARATASERISGVN